MREIKFRCWSKGTNEMIYFDLIHDFNLFRDDVKKTIMQFTGLLDKQGKEICEGDIVRGTTRGNIFETKSGIIKFIGGSFAIHYFGEDVDDNQPIGKLYEIEIIGNIYENKEIL